MGKGTTSSEPARDRSSPRPSSMAWRRERRTSTETVRSRSTSSTTTSSTGSIVRPPNQTPGKWSFDVAGDLYVARSARGVRPAPLPDYVKDLISNPLSSARVTGVDVLRDPLIGEHPALALAAQEALQTLSGDDSRLVSSAATRALESAGAEVGGSTRTREEQERTAREEQERTARGGGGGAQQSARRGRSRSARRGEGAGAHGAGGRSARRGEEQERTAREEQERTARGGAGGARRGRSRSARRGRSRSARRGRSRSARRGRSRSARRGGRSRSARRGRSRSARRGRSRSASGCSDAPSSSSARRWSPSRSRRLMSPPSWTEDPMAHPKRRQGRPAEARRRAASPRSTAGGVSEPMWEFGRGCLFQVEERGADGIAGHRSPRLLQGRHGERRFPHHARPGTIERDRRCGLRPSLSLVEGSGTAGLDAVGSGAALRGASFMASVDSEGRWMVEQFRDGTVVEHEGPTALPEGTATDPLRSSC